MAALNFQRNPANPTSQANFENCPFIQKSLLSFRSLQILTSRYNNFARVSLVCFLLTCSLWEIVLSWILISPTHVPLPLKLFFFAVIFEVVIAISLIYGFAADLHYQSTKVMGNITKYSKVRRSKYLKRFFSSSQVLRVEFAVTNYLEKTTPLMFQKFCGDRILDLLLLGKGKHSI